MRHFILAAAATFCLVPGDCVTAAYRNELISEPAASRHGLTRPWFSQVTVDQGRARVQDVIYHGGVLYVQTTQATVHALDAESGQTLWTRQVGRPGHPSMPMGVGRDLLGVVNGSRLYVVNRYNGELLHESQINGAPGAGPAISEKRAYVPLANGLIMAYRLEPMTDPLKELGKAPKDLTDEQKALAEKERRENIRLRQDYIPPLACQGQGRTAVPVLVTYEDEHEELVAWPSDRGFLFAARISRRDEDRLAVKFRLTTGTAIRVRPAYLPADASGRESGIIVAATEDGFVYALDERNGDTVWRFASGEPIVESPVVVGDRAYAAVQIGGMYCLDAVNGSQLWFVPGVKQLLAVSSQRVYASDGLDRLLILNARTGARMDSMPIPGVPIRLTNSENDRIFLATDTGLVQCLREVEQAQPLAHLDVLRKKVAEQKKMPATKQKGLDEVAGKKTGAKAKAGEADADEPAGDDPFAAPGAKAKSKPKAKSEDAGDDPFAGGAGKADAPADAAGDDPFAGAAEKPKAKTRPAAKKSKKPDDEEAAPADAGAGADNDPFAPAEGKPKAKSRTRTTRAKAKKDADGGGGAGGGDPFGPAKQ